MNQQHWLEREGCIWHLPNYVELPLALILNFFSALLKSFLNCGEHLLDIKSVKSERILEYSRFSKISFVRFNLLSLVLFVETLEENLKIGIYSFLFCFLRRSIGKKFNVASFEELLELSNEISSSD